MLFPRLPSFHTAESQDPYMILCFHIFECMLLEQVYKFDLQLISYAKMSSLARYNDRRGNDLIMRAMAHPKAAE